jgi:hypothetical protein
MIRAALGVVVVSLAMVAPAWAQGTGISAVLVGDIVRFGGSEVRTVGGGSQSRDGEALTFGLRVDQALGSRWGVELEYVRGAEMENEFSAIPLITGLSSFQFASSSTSSLPFEVIRPLPPGGLTVLPNYRAEARRSTVSTLGWYRQPIGDRASLVYSAGLAFVIEETTTTYEFRGLPFQNTLPPVTNEFTRYTAAPVVGVDARVSLTDHASVVPGVRVIAVDSGLLIRPSVGLRWQF